MKQSAQFTAHVQQGRIPEAKLRCIHFGCNQTCWVRGSAEPDVNAVVLDDNDPMNEACEHIRAGDYEIVDEEAIDFEDAYI